VKSRDRTILIIVPALALVAAFWMLVLSPKREEASQLEGDVAALESEVAQAQQTADIAEQAREDFPEDYKKVVTLGKAVPQDDDTASLITQVSATAQDAKVDFRSLILSEDAEGEALTAPAPPATEAPATETPPAESQPTAETTTETAVTEPMATEAAAATLPIGATVGPAGLPVMPYELEFQGDFFNVADFVAGLDSGVTADENGDVSVDGRLLTIDGFSLGRDQENGFPSLNASFAITTYVTPETEGLTAGATPSGPAPVSAPAPGELPADTTAAETGVAP
jgi:Type II secretion system (T2SS), protein M